MTSSYDSFYSLSRSSSTESLVDQTFVELQPINLEFEHKGFHYKITFIKQKVGDNGEEKNIDLAYFTDYTGLSSQEIDQRTQELDAFKEQAKKMIDLMGTLANRPTNLATANSYTFNFIQKGATDPKKPESFILDSVTFKASAMSTEEKFEVKMDSYEGPAQQKIVETVQPLNKTIEKVTNWYLQHPKRHKLETPVVPSTSTAYDRTSLEPEDSSDDDEPMEKNTKREVNSNFSSMSNSNINSSTTSYSSIEEE